MNVKSHPSLIIGLDSPDDAGVYKLNDETALIQTLDFLTPVTDSPYEFGQIAAANSLSDVYAMGGEPITVMNIVCFPSCDLDADILAQTLKGGMDKIDESGAALVGGHSVEDDEFKYGLSVTGIVHPDSIWTNTGACVGDAVILTKPLGTGILSTAIKGRLASEEDIREAVTAMSMLNRKAAETAKEFQVHACTDVTGFGLAGHLVEVAKGSGKDITVFSSAVPTLKNALYFAGMGFVPAGAHKNRKFFDQSVLCNKEVDRALTDILFDPQTSGGLMIFLKKSDADDLIKKLKLSGINAARIGEVTGENEQGFLNII